MVLVFLVLKSPSLFPPPSAAPLFQVQVQELLWEKQQLLGLKDDIMAVIDYAHRTKAVSETLHSRVVLIGPSP